MELGIVGVPIVENLLFREFIQATAALRAVGERHLRIGKGSQEAFQPVGVNRIDMGTGKDDIFALRSYDALIQRVSKGEILRLVLHHPDGVIGGNLERTVS
jgi:hypothetical protein